MTGVPIYKMIHIMTTWSDTWVLTVTFIKAYPWHRGILCHGSQYVWITSSNLGTPSTKKLIFCQPIWRGELQEFRWTPRTAWSKNLGVRRTQWLCAAAGGDRDRAMNYRLRWVGIPNDWTAKRRQRPGHLNTGESPVWSLDLSGE